MKNYVLVVVLLISSLSLSQNNRKLKVGIAGTLGRNFIENLDPVNISNFNILNVRQPVGFSLGVCFKSSLTKAIDVNYGLDLLSVQGVRFLTSGYLYTSSYAYVEMPISLQYNFNKFKAKPFIILGAEPVFSFATSASVITMQNSAQTSRVQIDGKNGLFILPKIGFGIQPHKKRTVAYSLVFTKGFAPLVNFDAETFNPNSALSFDYQGTRLELGVNWYFNRKAKN